MRASDRYQLECDCTDTTCSANHGDQCHAEWTEQVYCCGAPDCVAMRVCAACAEDAVRSGHYTRSLGVLHGLNGETQPEDA